MPSGVGDGVDAVSFVGVRLFGVEIWGPLLYGGRLVMVADSVVRSPEELHALLVAERVRMLSQTPSAFDALQTADALYPELGEQLGLQTVVFGGEALEPARLSAWMHRHPGRPRMWSTCTGSPRPRCTRRSVNHRADVGVRCPPIGVPLAHLGFFVLDGWLRPAPVGWSVSCMWPVVVWRRGIWVVRI